MIFLFYPGTAVLIAFLLTPLAAQLAYRIDCVDHPGHRKIHKEPVAYLGGLAVFGAIFLVLGLAWVLKFLPRKDILENQKILVVFSAGLFMSLVGLWDDLFHISTVKKFFFQFVIAFLFVLFGYRFEAFQIPGFHPISLGVLAIPATVFWVLALVNAVNFVDGVDGLAGSVCAASFFLLAWAAAILGDEGTLLISLLFLGALLGFLSKNWHPAKIYLGDAGSNGLGMLLAGSLVALGSNSNWLPGSAPSATSLNQPFHHQIFILMILATYPVLEITFSIFRRLARGKPIYKADKGHLHHILMKAGWSHRGICLAALTITLIPGLAALAVLDNNFGKAAWLLIAAGLLFGLFFAQTGLLDFFHPYNIARSRPHFLIANHFINMQKLKLELIYSPQEALILLNQTCMEFGVQNYEIMVRHSESDKMLHFHWEHPPHDQREYLDYLKVEEGVPEPARFKDRISLKDGKAGAIWVFRPHTEEGDLDVEYRVLVSEFIRKALIRIVSLENRNPSGSLDADLSKNISQVSLSLLRQKALRRKRPSPVPLKKRKKSILFGFGQK